MSRLKERSISGALDISEIDTYTANRKWLMGSKGCPFFIEKSMKLPKNFSHYIQSGIYSVTVTDKLHLVHFTASLEGGIYKEHDFPSKIDTVIPAPEDGWFLVTLMSGELFLLDHAGQLKQFPKLANHLASSSFFWIRDERILYLIGGSLFSHVTCLSIAKSKITERVLFVDDLKAPISSISQVMDGKKRYLLVATFLSLLILEWPSFNSDPVRINTIFRSGQSKVCIPSFLASNNKKVAWLTHDELRLYTIEQLVDSFPGSIGISFNDLKNTIMVEPIMYLSQTTPPIAMIENYLILSAPSVLLFFSVDDLSMLYRFPFMVSPISYFNLNPNSKILSIITPQHLYKCDVSKESPYLELDTTQNLKEEYLQTLESSKIVTKNQLMYSLLEDKNYKKSITLLTNVMKKIIGKNDSKEKNIDKDVERICIQFLIFELEVISICEGGDITNLSPIENIPNNDCFDLLSSLAYMLRLRAFSPVSKKLFSKEVLDQFQGNKTTIMLLLENDCIVEAIDQIIKESPLSEMVNYVVYNSFEKLEPLFSQTSNPKICDLLSSIIPQISGKVPIKALLDLIQYDSKQKRPFDLLFWAFARNSQKAQVLYITQEGFIDPRYSANSTLSKSDQNKKIDPSDFFLVLLFNEQQKNVVSKACQAYKLGYVKCIENGIIDPNSEAFRRELLVVEKNGTVRLGVYEIYDEVLCDIIRNPKHQIHFMNHYHTYEQLKYYGLYHSAAEVALGVQFYSQAIKSVSLVHESIRMILIRRYIRASPKNLWNSFCTEYHITHIEDEERSTTMTKDKLATRLSEMRTRIKELEKSAKESAQFLQELDEWGGEGKSPSDKCPCCRKSLSGSTVIAFPCGHAFHNQCLLSKVSDTLSPNLYTELKDLCKQTKLSAENERKKDQLLTEDCPLCGLASINSLRINIVPAGYHKFPKEFQP